MHDKLIAVDYPRLFFVFAAFFMIFGLSQTVHASEKKSEKSRAVREYFRDDPACRVKSVEQAPYSYENLAIAPASGDLATTQLDKKGVYQLYVAKAGEKTFTCISCKKVAGGPRLDRNKPMVSWHPSGRWLVVGIEEDWHDLMWMPQSWQRGLVQSGIWLNIWIVTPDGQRWTQITNYKKSAEAPADGMVGTAFTPDGKIGVWAEIIDGNVFENAFGIWKLYAAHFKVKPDGTPSFVNKTDITPKGANWVEPGNFSPDGKKILISADVGMEDAQGQDQYVLNLETGKLVNLTNSPDVWDEHGLFSPNGRKIVFMSSYPYRHEQDSHKTLSLKTEFMMIDSDGGRLQQLTHFNETGYPESQKDKTIAAVGGFFGDGSQIYATVMAPEFTKTNWIITFEGRCGG